MIGGHVKTLIDWEPGAFYRLGNGHAIVTEAQAPGTYELGIRFNLICMFEMWTLLRDGKQVGHFFMSGMRVETKGSYIVTYMASKRGKATESQLVIRCPEFVLFDLPGCGAMAISTKISAHMQKILEGQ